jgi:hypothetical protein
LLPPRSLVTPLRFRHCMASHASVVPGSPSTGNGPGVWTCAVAGCRTLPVDRRVGLRWRGLGGQGELLAGQRGGGSPPPPRPPPLDGEDLDAAEGPLRRRRQWPSDASGCLCPVDDFAESAVVGVAVPPGDVAADHAGLLVMTGMVGAVQGEVAQRLERGLDLGQPGRLGGGVGQSTLLAAAPCPIGGSSLVEGCGLWLSSTRPSRTSGGRGCADTAGSPGPPRAACRGLWGHTACRG